ncbi:hypothetical protein Tco_1430240 [Tanacetum coccineum]
MLFKPILMLVDSLPPYLSPVAVMILLWRRLSLILADDGIQYHQDCRDCEDFCFVILKSFNLPAFNWGIRFPNLIDYVLFLAYLIIGLRINVYLQNTRTKVLFKWISTLKKEKPSQISEKSEHGNEKDCAKSRPKSKEMSKSESIPEESAVIKPEPEMKNTSREAKNSISMEDVKTNMGPQSNYNSPCLCDLTNDCEDFRRADPSYLNSLSQASAVLTFFPLSEGWRVWICLVVFYIYTVNESATKGLLDKAKGNVLGMEIVRDQSGNTLRVSQSRGLCCGKNGKWSCIYAVGSQEYQVVWTRPDIASVGVNMSDGFDRGLQTNVQVFMDFDYAMSRSITVYGLMILGCSGSLKANLQHIEALSITEAGYMTFTEAWKKEIWPKGPILAVSRIGVSI